MNKTFLSFLVIMAGISPAQSQEAQEKDIALEEVQIEALSNRSIINKAIGNLHKRTKESISLCNGQLTQIMEADGNVVQLSREYGYYISSSYYEKMRNKFDGFWHSNFVPVYNARSLRYTLDGKTVLPASYSYPEETYPWSNHYDARAKYMFEILRAIYLYGPVYSRNYSDYVFKCIGTTDDSYLFHFEPSDRYPQKNPLYAKGLIEIDAASFKLKSIRIDNMGLLYAGRYSDTETALKRYPDYHDEKILKDCIDSDFNVNEDGEIDYALIHILWSPDNTQYYQGGRGSQPRANVAGTDFIVTECWQSEPLIVPDNLPGQEKAVELTDKQFKNLISLFKVIGLNPDGNSYNPEAIDKIDWALDVSDAERQLNQKMPIREQYKLQSKDYSRKEEEMIVNKDLEKADISPQQKEAQRAIHELIRNNFFKDPLR